VVAGLVVLALAPSLVLAGPRRAGGGDVDQLVDTLEPFDVAVRAQRTKALRAVVELGSSYVPAVFDVLAGSAPPASPEGPFLTGERRAFLLEVVGQWPLGEVLAELSDVLPADATLDERLLVVELLGAVGDRDAIEPMIELLVGVNPAAIQHRRVHDKVSSALRSALNADPRGYAELERCVFPPSGTALEAAQISCVAKVLGQGGRGSGVAFLGRCLGRSRQLDVTVLEALGAMRPWESEVLGGDCAKLVARKLRSSSPEVRRASAIAAGKLGAFEATDQLVGLLADPEAKVGAAAHWALRELSGLDWPPDPERWRVWYQIERDWFDSSFETLIDEVRREDRGRAVQALRELSSHAPFRTRVVEPLAPLLASTDAALVSAVCGALQRLDAGGAVPYLVAALDGAEPAARESIVACLQRLTGATAGADAREWLDWLGS